MIPIELMKAGKKRKKKKSDQAERGWSNHSNLSFADLLAKNLFYINQNCAGRKFQ